MIIMRERRKIASPLNLSEMIDPKAMESFAMKDDPGCILTADRIVYFTKEKEHAGEVVTITTFSAF